MKKNLNFKLVVWLLIGTFMVNLSGSIWAMEPLKNISAQTKAKLLARYNKDSKLKQLVDSYRKTKELRRKKVAGTATKKELKELDKRIKRIRIAAAAIGVTLAVIATVAQIVRVAYIIGSDDTESEVDQNLLFAIKNNDTKKAKTLISQIPTESPTWRKYASQALEASLNAENLEIAQLILEKQVVYTNTETFKKHMAKGIIIARKQGNQIMEGLFRSNLEDFLRKEFETPPVEPRITIKVDEAIKEIIPTLKGKPGTEFTWHEILGVSENPSCDNMKNKYLNFARTIHPDKNPAEGATEAFQAVVAAYEEGQKKCQP